MFGFVICDFRAHWYSIRVGSIFSLLFVNAASGTIPNILVRKEWVE